MIIITVIIRIAAVITVIILDIVIVIVIVIVNVVVMACHLESSSLFSSGKRCPNFFIFKSEEFV